MKTLFQCPAAIATVLIATPACAQSEPARLPPVKSWGSGALVPGSATMLVDSSGAEVGRTNPLPTSEGPLAPATSTALAGTASPGTTVVGPFTPQLGRGIRVTLRGTWSGTFAVGTSIDACSTISPLTIAGTTWGSFTGSANEVVDIPSLAGVVYCATATVSSGSLSYGVRQ